MLIRLIPNDSMPLHIQIAGSLRDGILNGTVTDGERLPPAKSLGESLGVSLHTVLHAYQDLRDEGLIELRRGRGAVVTAVPQAVLGTANQILDDAIERLAELNLPHHTAQALFRLRLESAATA